MICPNCGAEVNLSTANYCANCGKKIESRTPKGNSYMEASQHTTNAQAKRKFDLPGIVLVAFGVIVVLSLVVSATQGTTASAAIPLLLLALLVIFVVAALTVLFRKLEPLEPKPSVGWGWLVLGALLAGQNSQKALKDYGEYSVYLTISLLVVGLAVYFGLRWRINRPSQQWIRSGLSGVVAYVAAIAVTVAVSYNVIYVAERGVASWMELRKGAMERYMKSLVETSQRLQSGFVNTPSTTEEISNNLVITQRVSTLSHAKDSVAVSFFLQMDSVLADAYRRLPALRGRLGVETSGLEQLIGLGRRMTDLEDASYRDLIYYYQACLRGDRFSDRYFVDYQDALRRTNEVKLEYRALSQRVFAQ